MSRSFFRVGGLSGGRLYLFTGLGEFRTHAAAVERYNSLPRFGREYAVVVETTPLVKHCVEYGFSEVVRDLAGRLAR